VGEALGSLFPLWKFVVDKCATKKYKNVAVNKTSPGQIRSQPTEHGLPWSALKCQTLVARILQMLGSGDKHWALWAAFMIFYINYLPLNATVKKHQTATFLKWSWYSALSSALTKAMTIEADIRITEYCKLSALNEWMVQLYWYYKI